MRLVWPALSEEERSWSTRFRDDDLTRAQRERVRRPYRAALLPRIDQVRLAVTGDLAAEADEAARLLGRFDAEVGPGGLPFASILLRSESAASSEIEHLTSGARAIGEAELDERTQGNAVQIVRNVRSMQAALALSDRIDADGIIAMHEALLGADSGITGRWREEQVWIGGDGLSPHLADFVPPHHERVADSMRDLVRFADRTDLPALVHAATLHAQFETVHPFPDGNGRTGRALVQALLRHREVTTNIAVPISAGLLHDVDDYFAALTAYRAGDAAPIVRSFSRAAGYAVANGRALMRDVRGIEEEWSMRMRGLRADAGARRIAVLALDHPVLNYDLVVERLGVVPQTAFNGLAALVERGVLRPANSQRRNRIWLAEPVLQALDEFAARAGRRRLPGSTG